MNLDVIFFFFFNFAKNLHFANIVGGRSNCSCRSSSSPSYFPFGIFFFVNVVLSLHVGNDVIYYICKFQVSIFTKMNEVTVVKFFN